MIEALIDQGFFFGSDSTMFSLDQDTIRPLAPGNLTTDSTFHTFWRVVMQLTIRQIVDILFKSVF